MSSLLISFNFYFLSIVLSAKKKKKKSQINTSVNLATNYKLGFCLNCLLFAGLILLFVSTLFQII